MDVLTELLTPTPLVKSENASKDKRQRNSRYQQVASASVEEDSGEKSNVTPLRTKQHDWLKNDRRKGGERRSSSKKRGRWLDSRSKKDRRAIERAISMKV